MNSVVRLSFFIVLSLALHIVSLPFDFMSPAELHNSKAVGVAFVSGSLDTFYTAPQTEISTVPKVQKLRPAVQKSVAEPLRLPRKKRQKPETTMPAPAPERKSRPLMVAAKRRTLTADKLKPSVRRDEPPSAHPDVAVPVVVQKELNPAPVPQPLEKTAGKTRVSLEDTLSSAEEKKVDPESRLNAPARIPVSQGEEVRGAGKGFRNALPRYDINPHPRYPDVAKLRGWEGKVVFRAQVLKSGRVGDLQILVSSGYRSLDNAARKAIARWKFRPATLRGVLIDSQVEIPVTFSLKSL